MEALTEFHPYPRLPREVQNMIWGFYSKSLPVLRHNFHLHRAQNGDESCHYILYNEETKFFVQTQFRCEQDELSLVQYVFPASLICSLGSISVFSVPYALEYSPNTSRTNRISITLTMVLVNSQFVIAAPSPYLKPVFLWSLAQLASPELNMATRSILR